MSNLTAFSISMLQKLSMHLYFIYIFLFGHVNSSELIEKQFVNHLDIPLISNVIVNNLFDFG